MGSGKVALPKKYPHLAQTSVLLADNTAIRENRIWSKVIDLLIVGLLSWISSWLTNWLAYVLPLVLFSLFDSMGRGQSPGKWLMGLFTIEVKKGAHINLYQGLLRNFPFILGFWAFWCESPFYRFIFGVPALLMVAIEFFFVINIKGGVRVGDVVTNTRVFEYKDEHTLFIEQFVRQEVQNKT